MQIQSIDPVFCDYFLALSLAAGHAVSPPDANFRAHHDNAHGS